MSYLLFSPLLSLFLSPPFTPGRGLLQVHGIDVCIAEGSYCRCAGNRGCRPSCGPDSDDKRALSWQRRGACEGDWISGEGGYVLRRGVRGKRGGGRGARQCILSPLLLAICSPITHTVYMFTNTLCFLSPVPPSPPSSLSEQLRNDSFNACCVPG